MTGALTPREFAERALVGTLLWQPGRVIDIAAWLDPKDFRTPAIAAVYQHLRDMVAEATARVGRRAIQVHGAGGSGPMPVTTGAEDALRVVSSIAGDLRDMRHSPARWASVDMETERYRRADAVARYAAEYPGLIQRLTPDARAVIDAVLPLAGYSPYAVPGVDAVSVLERMSRSTELGDRSITAPFLHTLMASTPGTSTAQPEVYAQMVLEASIRREVQRSGMRVAQVSETNVELAGLLAAVDTALSHVEAIRQRWDAVTGRRGIGIALGQQGRHRSTADSQQVEPDSTTSGLDLVRDAPTEQDIVAAEETVVATTLVRPETLGRLVDRLYPEDFADRELGNTFRAAVDVRAGAQITGRRVDPVTVAWEQQRNAAQHGPGTGVERLMRIVERGPTSDVEYAADVVMRGRLARVTAEAAATVQEAAQHPGLQPADMLHTTTLAYDAVRATARRMSGEPSIQTRLSGLDTAPTTQATVRTPRSSANVIQLRERSADLRAALSNDVSPTSSGEDTTGKITARLDPQQDIWPHLDPDIAEADFGPDPGA